MVLSRHPAIWDTCLKTVGILSNNLEKLLINWIKSGDDNQCKLAIELISPRLSKDRLRQLISILPNLERSKAEFLARNLLYYLENRYNKERPFFELDIEYLQFLSKCVPYIDNKDEYLKNNPNPVKSKYGRDENINTIAIFLSNNKKQISEKFVYENFRKSIEYTKIGQTLYLLILSSLIALNFYLSTFISYLFFIFYALLFVVETTKFNFPPWYSFRIRNYNDINKYSLIFIIGFFSTFIFGVRINDFGNPSEFYSYLFVSILITVYGIISLKYNYIWLSFSLNKLFSKLSYFIFALWVTYLIVLIITSFENINCFHWAWIPLTLFFIYFISYYFYLFSSFRIIDKAKKIFENKMMESKIFEK